jgi:hypothetical protein
MTVPEKMEGNLAKLRKKEVTKWKHMDVSSVKRFLVRRMG